MNRSIKCTVLIVMVALLSLPAFGGGVKKIAQTGMKWLSIPIGARASALGGAFTAYTGDASAIFWNPASAGFSKNSSVFLSQTRWIADINVDAAAAVVRLGRGGVVGLSVAAVEWGDFHGTRRAATPSGYEETGAFSPSNWSAGIAYAYQVSQQFAFGGHIRYLHESLGSTLEGKMDDPRDYTGEMNLVAVDFGTLYYTGLKDLRFGMLLQNFSQEKAYRIESYPLPLTFRFGLAMDLMKLLQENGSHSLTLSIDAMHPRDYSERLHFGTEYGFKNMLFLRAGYKTNYDEEDLSFGAGLNIRIQQMAAGLHYSYNAFKHFDAVHMFSFDFYF